MLSNEQQTEIKKFFLNALKRMVDTPTNRSRSLNGSTVTEQDISAIKKQQGLCNSDAKTLLNAFRKATTATNLEKLKKGMDFEEIKTFLIDYQTNTLLVDLFERPAISAKTPLVQSNASDTIWPMINQNIDRLDAELKVDNFYETYGEDLEKIAKVSLFALAVGAAATLTFFAVKALTSDGDTPLITPSFGK